MKRVTYCEWNTKKLKFKMKMMKESKGEEKITIKSMSVLVI